MKKLTTTTTYSAMGVPARSRDYSEVISHKWNKERSEIAIKTKTVSSFSVWLSLSFFLNL